jgi:adenylate cyclase
MAGVIGTRKFVYDVWGDTVNMAAGVEAASQPNRVLVSAATAKILGGDFVLDGPQILKPKRRARSRRFSSPAVRKMPVSFCREERVNSRQPARPGC